MVLAESRFSGAAKSIESLGMHPYGVVYNDDFALEIRGQILGLDAVQVWVNPITGGRDRSKLDALLRDVASAGVRVFTHPDVILKMGTKQVLADTREASFGSNVRVFLSLDALRDGLKSLLGHGAVVLKQHRGHSGGGIWKFSIVDGAKEVTGSTLVHLRHAERGSEIDSITYDLAIDRMSSYFESGGRMFAQPFQERIAEGMARIYMVRDEVAGFGHQAAVALAPESENGTLPKMGPRLYYPPHERQFSRLRHLMETQWLDELTSSLDVLRADLPLLWDADFMLGPRDAMGEDSYVLCEINVSCVSPYPEWANEPMARHLREILMQS